MEQIKSSAPALERGIKLLDLLENSRAMSLEELARDLGAPKSSVLRLADTLESLGIIERSERDKAYRARYVLTPTAEDSPVITEVIKARLRPLCEETSCTAEWYVYDRRNRAFKITERAEPRNAAVFVRARIGFLRELDRELEAVTALGLALKFGELNRDKPLWIRKDGVNQDVYLSYDEAKSHVERAGGELFAEDFGYNIQGVRRMAAAVIDGEGRPAGILALAQSFSPGGEEISVKNALLLKEAVRKIEITLKCHR